MDDFDLIQTTHPLNCFFPLGVMGRRTHTGEGRVHSWEGHQFIAGPYVKICGFGTLLKCTPAVI